MKIPRKVITFLIGMLAFGLTGCAINKDYRRPEIDLPSGWRLEYQAAADLANTRWWEQFQDPALNELIQIALNENKDVRIAAARVEEFTARLQTTKSGYYPQLNYDIGGYRDQQSLERELPSLTRNGDRRNSTYHGTAIVGWELDLWGKLGWATDAAKAELLAAEEGRHAVILTLVSQVAEGYISLISLDKLLMTAKQTIAFQDEFLRLFERKREGGQVTDMEVARVRAAYEQVAEYVPDIERRIALQENALSVLLGRNPSGIARGGTLDALLMPEIPQGLPSDLLMRRPDIRQSEQNLIAANARVGVARTQYFPTISLTGLFGYASEALSDLLQSSANFWRIGADAAGPIFAGGRIKGNVRQAKAQQQQLLNEYLRTIQTAFREVDDSLVSVQKGKERLAVQERHIAALTEYASLAHSRYDAKYISYIEVLEAEKNLFNARINNIETRNNLYGAIINSYKVMGGGWVAKAANEIGATDKKIEAPGK